MRAALQVRVPGGVGATMSALVLGTFRHVHGRQRGVQVRREVREVRQHRCVRARGAGEREKRERAREDDAEAALGNHHGEARSDAADDGTFDARLRRV